MKISTTNIFFILSLLISYNSHATFLDHAFINLAKQVKPSVVNIAATKKGKQGTVQLLPGFYIPYSSPSLQSAGSGFIISRDGLIVTNAHVVRSVDKIQIQFEGESTFYPAKLLGKDNLSDIALLKIKINKKLKPIVFGDSEKLQVGQWVAAIGNPHGYGHTMTKGIISAVKREIDDLNLFPLIQTDASINLGNSGGPLVNLKGEVVGVNNAIAAGASGISFAIPINNVKTILKDLKNYGYVRRGYIGIQFKELFGVSGVLVTGLIKNGPAHRAGLRVGDLIIKFNNKDIKASKDLPNAVSKVPVGKSSKMLITRKDKKISINIVTEIPNNKNSAVLIHR